MSTTFFRGDGLADAENAHLRVQDFWTAIGNILNDDLNILVEGEVIEQNPANGEITQFWPVDPFQLQCSSADEVLLFAVQGNLTYQTLGIVASRRVVGRMFIPGLNEGVNIAGTLALATQAGLATAAENTLGDSSEGSPHIVWSRPQTGRAGSMHNVTNYQVRPNFAVLTSRRD